MRTVPFDLAGDQVAGDDAACLAINDNDIEHLVAIEHLHRAFPDLAHQRAVCTKQQLLTRLPACIEGAAHLHTTE